MKNILENFQNIQQKGTDIWGQSSKSPCYTARIFKKTGARFITISAYLDDNKKDITLYYHFALNSQVFSIKHKTKGFFIDSIVDIYPASDWIEREIFETYGIRFKNHKNLTNLLVTTKIKTPLLNIEKAKNKNPKH